MNSTRFRAYFDELAQTRELFVRRNRYYYRDLVKFLHHVVPAEATVVELGCGIGTVIGALANEHKTGIDFSDKMLEQARRMDSSGTRYINDNIENLDHAECYDVVIQDTILALYDVQRALTEVRKNLCEDHTRLVILYYSTLWEPVLRLGEKLGIKTPMPEPNWLARADVQSLLDLSGFQVVTEGARLLCPRFVSLLSWCMNTVLEKLAFLRHLCFVQHVIARPRPTKPDEYSVSVLIPARKLKFK